MERTVLIYYSLESHTHFIAQKIGEQLSCESIRLLPLKEFSRNRFLKYFWAGKSAAFKEKPPLANKDIDLTLYDTLIIASPVWAGNISSPVRSFLSAYAIEDKNIYLIANSSGGPCEKCLSTMRGLLPKSTIKGTACFVQPSEASYASFKDRLDAFCTQIQEES
ncbi:hypothetical protein [Sphaerochaeta sp. PS]|uniref:flavodoxin family protein n=1 Tax=Sphaerochaeta sp. PS TaxID=3076336 RepID=UPI0028A30D02|nr:hypothetical protein [Sphaerochaeta sp. PS]MDT4763405.1 hypothetical protein [Sphaerochaeta sp. PS]